MAEAESRTGPGTTGGTAHQHEVPYLQRGTVDPSAGAGVTAPLGAIYQRANGSAGEIWIKTSTPDTGWQKQTTP